MTQDQAERRRQWMSMHQRVQDRIRAEFDYRARMAHKSELQQEGKRRRREQEKRQARKETGR
jgi:hypothetical protein